MILVCAKTSGWRSNRVPPTDSQVAHFKNPDNDPRGSYFDGNPVGSPHYRENLVYDIRTPSGNVIKSPRNGWRWSEERYLKMLETGEIRFNKDETGIRRRTYLADRNGLPPSTFWADLDVTGHNRQAKYEQKKLFPERTKEEWFGTPKPEKLLNRIMTIASNPGDWVLDSFAGSGTTGAVAQKMGRQWIMVELEETCHTHIIPRLKKVIDGDDAGGITEAAEWKGGGGFRYYRIGPSLIEKDKFGNPVISSKFNAAMLAEALCKLEGFTYAPSETVYWQHGHSTERDFAYVTTQTLTSDQLAKLSDEVGEDRSLLVLCCAFRVKPGKFANLTIKKIPKAVLQKCEWGKDDYSLEIKNLPAAPIEEEEPEALPAKPRRKFGKGKTVEPTLFDMEVER